MRGLADDLGVTISALVNLPVAALLGGEWRMQETEGRVSRISPLASVDDDWRGEERAQDEHGREGGEGANPRMREQELNARMLTGDGGDLVVELSDPGGQTREQLEVIIAAPCGMRRQRQRLQSGETLSFARTSSACPSLGSIRDPRPRR